MAKTPRAEALGARLRALRREAGISAEKLAEKLGPGWRQSKIAKIETGARVPTAEEVTAIAAAVGADPGPLLALRGKASAAYAAWRERLEQAGGGAAFQDQLAALEASCAFLGEYQPAMIPGLLQTPAYARQMFGPAGDIDLSGEEIGRLVAAKVRRGSILHEGSRRIVHVLGEAALRTRIGQQTAETLRGQLEHLIEVAGLPGHELGVIPFAAAVPIEPASGFVVYDEDLVGIDHAGGDLQIADPDQVARYRGWLEALLEVAVTGDEAVALIRRVLEDLS